MVVLRRMLDASVCIAFFRGKPQVVTERLMAALDGDGSVALSSVVVFELESGIAGARDRGLMSALLRWSTVFALEAGDAVSAAAIRADLRAKGTPIGPYDILIAGHALARNLTLVTENAKEFARVPGLRVESWSA